MLQLKSKFLWSFFFEKYDEYSWSEIETQKAVHYFSQVYYIIVLIVQVFL